jgi:hypothetical protein
MQSKLIDLGFEYFNGKIVISETETEGGSTMLTTYNSAFNEFSFTKAYISTVKVLTPPTITIIMRSNCLVRANKKRDN